MHSGNTTQLNLTQKIRSTDTDTDPDVVVIRADTSSTSPSRPSKEPAKTSAAPQSGATKAAK